MRVSPPAFYAWEKSAKQQLLGRRVTRIEAPVNLQMIFYCATSHRRDLSALYEAPQDVLVDMGILKDDNYTIVAGHDGSRVRIDPANPRIEITITPLES